MTRSVRTIPDDKAPGGTPDVGPYRPPAAPGGGWKRVILLAGFIVAVALVFVFDLDRFLRLDALRDHKAVLESLVSGNRIAAALAFVAIYAASTALSVPGATVLTVAGGFLFGLFEGTAYAVIGASLGAVAVFQLARTAIGEPLRRRAGPAMKRMEAGFNENALSYLLVLRLVPLFPFFIVNVVPALLGVRLSTYAMATFFGIIPGAFVYASVGAGLGSVLESGKDLTLEGVLTPEILTALIGLAILALLPVAYKSWRRKRRDAAGTCP